MDPAESLLNLNADRIRHLRDRIGARGLSAAEAVIVVLDVDDQLGGEIAEVLMPGHDWSAYRARGEVPVARGLATRPGMQELLDEFAPTAGRSLAAITGVAAVGITAGRIAVALVLSDEQGG